MSSSSSSSSSCRAARTDFLDYLSPFVSIFHCFWLVFKTTSCVLTKLLYIGSSWLSNTCAFVRRGPLENLAYEFAFTSPAVSHMFVRLIWMVLGMGGKCPYSCCFVGYCFQNLFNIAHSILLQFLSSFFSLRLVGIHVVHPYSRIDMTTAWKKLRFILSDKFDFHMIDNLSIAVYAFTRLFSYRHFYW